MTPESIKNRRLVGVFLLGCVLFNYPILSLFSRRIALLGIPALYLYVFCAWALLIALIIISVQRRGQSIAPPKPPKRS